MSGTYPNPIARRRRPQPVVSVASGFVLILVLPAAMLLIMTALSLVTRSNSAAVASSQESRAQAARMSAEYGFSQVMALVNTKYFSDKPLPFEIDSPYTIANSKAAKYNSKYTIRSFDLDTSSPVTPCSDIASGDKVNLTIVGLFTDDTTTYKREISRTLSVCAPPAPAAANQLRVRAIK